MPLQSLAFRPWRQARQTPSALPIEPKPLRKMKPGTQTNAYIGRSYFSPRCESMYPNHRMAVLVVPSEATSPRAQPQAGQAR
jgi:hypothetical protein